MRVKNKRLNIFTMKKKKVYIIFIISIAIGILIFPILHISSLKKEDRMFIENEYLIITGQYKIKTLLSEIEKVYLSEEIPDFNRRTKGFSLADIKKGYFIGTDSIEYYVNVNTEFSPYNIHIQRKKETPMIINMKDSIDTVSFYELIKMNLIN